MMSLGQASERTGDMEANKKIPLFIITGASGVGKSTMSEILFKKEAGYIVLESDLLWNDIYNTPDDGYRSYRELWLRVCNNISQIGMPVVLCGCAVPEQFEVCSGRNGFLSIHYLAVVSDDDVLEERMRCGRGITDDNWIKSSIDFNRWLKDNADKTTPSIKLINNSKITPQLAAELADAWIHKCMAGIQP
jgi:predicted ABC-type ATPase